MTFAPWVLVGRIGRRGSVGLSWSGSVGRRTHAPFNECSRFDHDAVFDRERESSELTLARMSP
jgi:hypothetical protein